jgi:putative secretion ATPase (PEP-CTERM system associated)
MYADFYRLTELPFRLTPDPRFFFYSAGHRKAFSHLTYGVHSGEGFVIITGDIGAGKTTLVDHLLSKLDASRYSVGKIVTTQLAGDDLLRVIAGVFEIAYQEADKATLLRRIEEFTIAQRRSGKRALLIIDEAQNLSFGAIEELRMLSNIIFEGTTALQSILLGQPQFRSSLASPRLEQLRQRVTAIYHLGPLSLEETQKYIEHRLRRVSWTGDPEFTSGTFPLIYRYTEGVPRRVNLLCSRLLLSGFLESLHSLSEETVKEVAEELQSEEIQEATYPTSPAGADDATQLRLLLDELTQRINALEQRAEKDRRTIKAAIEMTMSLTRAMVTDD